MITVRAKLKSQKLRQLRTLFEDAVQERCAENNCCLGLHGLSNYIILKGENILPDKKACDCVIFHDSAVPHIVIVELKRGRVKSGQIQEKFESTLNWLSKIEEELCARVDCKIILLLLHGRGISKAAHVDLRAHAFKSSKGRRHSLQILPCNAQLADLYGRTVPRGGNSRRGRRV